MIFTNSSHRVCGRRARSSGLGFLCWAALLAGCRAAPAADTPSSGRQNVAGTNNRDSSVQPATAWAPEAKALFPQEKIDQPWAQRIEIQLRDGLAALGLMPSDQAEALKAAYLELRRRVHELALDERGRTVPASGLVELRRFVMRCWSEVFGEPPAALV